VSSAWSLSSSELVLSVWAPEAESVPGKAFSAVKRRWVKCGEDTAGHNTLDSAIVIHCQDIQPYFTDKFLCTTKISFAS